MLQTLNLYYGSIESELERKCIEEVLIVMTLIGNF